MKTYRPLILTLFFALLSGYMPAQGFSIKNFDVKIKLYEDGHFDVTETLNCEFTESKHGIFRDIPFEYTVQNIPGEVAINRGLPGSKYKIYLEDLDVEGHEFKIESNGAYKRLRIGSASSYVNGAVTYKISYSVYGAINIFSKSQEFYWNLTGNGWPVDINKVTYQVELPKNVNFGPADLKIFTGAEGSRLSDGTISQQGRIISGATNSNLSPRQGATIGIRFPSNYLRYEGVPMKVFAKNYIIDSIVSDFTVNEDGTVDVVESAYVNAKVNGAEFIRGYPKSYAMKPAPGCPEDIASTLNLPGNMQVEIGQIFEYYNKDEENPGLTFNETSYNSSLGLTLTSNRSLKDYQQIFEIHYKIYGAVKLDGSTAYAHLMLYQVGSGDPVARSKFRIHLPKGKDAKQVNGLRTFSSQDQPKVVKNSPGNYTLILNSELKAYEAVGAQLKFSGEGMSVAKIPIRLTADKFYYKNYEVNYLLHDDGTLHNDYKLDLSLFNTVYYYNFDVRMAYNRKKRGYWFEEDKAVIYDLPYSNLFTPYHRLGVTNVEAPEARDIYISSYSGLSVDFTLEDPNTKSDSIRIKYDLFGLMKKDGGERILHFPGIPSLEEPVDQMKVSLRLEEGKDFGNAQLEARVYSGDSMLYASPFTKEGDAMVWMPPVPLQKDQRIDFHFRLPASAASGSLYKSALLVYYNNKFLIFPLGIFLVLLILWFLFGRDKKTVKMVQFTPPEGVTPAEAGLLIDAKLHNQDLVSLIYYWADKGYLRIEEIAKTGKRSVSDYYLIRIRKLPATANKYEKTIFDGIFSSTKKKKVSSLRYSFYTKMSKARKELEKKAAQEKFFLPGTRGFAGLLKFFKVIAFIGTFGSLIYVWFFSSHYLGVRWDIPLSLGAMYIIFYVFSKIMPRRGPYGQKVWSHLIGFYEFIKTAEADRLKRLLDEDPAYFEHTLAYAIAFGLANDWAKKFDGLVTASPDWYKSKSGDDFDTRVFTQSVMRSVLTMNSSFTATPASSSGGSSYSGSSWSSSSSSFGSSGGSFGGGGGYSGGGFGGGGGGSW